jgi:hypothetical protein
MAVPNDMVELLIRDAFQFLQADHGFQIWEIVKNNYGCFVMYKGEHVAIRVSDEIYDGGIFVRFYKLKDGKIPPYPIFFDRDAEYLIFDFSNLLILRTGSFIEQDSRRIYEESDYVKETLRRFAEAIKRHASDVLKGDFSVLPAIKRLVIRRAKELEHEM